MRSATPKPVRRRRLLACCTLLLLAAAVASLLWPVAQLPLTISSPTTLVVAERRPDGSPDYLAAFEARVATGAKSDNNAALPLFAAFGSLFARHDSLTATLAAFGKQGLPDDLRHFTSFAAFTLPPGKVWTPNENGDWPLEPDPANATALATLQTPWLADTHPRIADWLDVNEAPLDVVREASRRPRLWRPHVPRGDDRRLHAVLAAHPQGLLRGAARALACRAMRSLYRGERQAAWDDLRAGLAVAALATQEGGALALALGHSTELDLAPAVASLLGDETLTLAEAVAIGTDLERLPAMRPARDSVADERLSVLDHVLALTATPGRVDLRAYQVPGWLTPGGWEPDAALRLVNRWFDELDRVLGAESHPARVTAAADLVRRLQTNANHLRSATGSLVGWIGMAMRGPAERRRRLSELTAITAVSLVLPELATTHESGTAHAARRSLWRLGAALAAHRAEHGDYPATLEALVPAYLGGVPFDPVSGKPFEYRLVAKGYRLAWLGLDGRTDALVLTAPRP